MPDAWITIAVLGRVRGNRGELAAAALSDKPERYQRLREVWLFRDETGSKLEVESVWHHAERLIFKFRGIDSISDAEPWQGAEVRVPVTERIELEPGEYFQSDLIGCEVRDQRSGESLGRVGAWQEGGGAGLLELEDGLLIPFAGEICVSIDVAAKLILVVLPEGLRDLNPS